MNDTTTTNNSENLNFTSSNTGKTASEHIVDESSVKSMQGVTSTNDTTIFVDDKNVVSKDENHVAHVDESLLSMNDTDTMNQSIVSFLAKPIKLATGNFSTTDTYSFLNNYSMPFAAFIATQGIVWLEKLAGIYGIRMDMRFRIVINANRFQQGRYCMGWVPLCGAVRSTSALKELSYNNLHMATLVQRTTIPHVEFDLCNDTAAELLVPYVSSRNFYEMSSAISGTDRYSLGYLNIYPYSPLVSPAGSTTAGYTIYVSFENVRLFGASSAQSGLKGVSNKEIGAKMSGPISSAALAISKGFKEFSQVPLLSTYSVPIAWVADRVANVASIFGWSKPTAGDNNLKVQLLVAPNHNTVDGDSDARPFSFLSKPGVTTIAGVAGTDFDEMDFSYIVRKSAWFTTSSWATSAVSDTVISTINVGPYYYAYSAAGTTSFTPVGFVANMFYQWRGSLVYKIKFVRTEFHSGRVQIAFYPLNPNGSTYSANPAYVHRMIVDIRETPEVEFVVPYIAPIMWTPVYNSNTSTGGLTGKIVVSVADPLVAPATVSTSVTLLWEVAGGEDFEVSMPGNFPQTPTLITPQSGLNDDKLVIMNVGNSTVSSNPIIASSAAVGDKITNFRAFLKRFYPMVPNDVGSSSTLLLNTSMIYTYFDSVPILSGSPTYWQRADMVAVVASCYGIWRGGVRIRDVINKNLIASPMGSVTSCVKTFSAIPSSGFVTTTVGTTAANFEVTNTAHLHFQELRNNGIISIECPQYTNTISRNLCDAMYFQGSGAGYGYAQGNFSSTTNQYAYIGLPLNGTNPPNTIVGQQLHNLYRALADDGSFGTFISIPPMTFGLTAGAFANLA